MPTLLVAHLHFLPTHKANQKIQKSHQANTPRQTKMNGQITYGEEGRTANKVLPKAGRNDFDSTFVQDSTAVILLNFCAKNPRLRQYPKRWR